MRGVPKAIKNFFYALTNTYKTFTDLCFHRLENLMPETQKNNPLHGITLEKIVTDLYLHFGWEVLGGKIKIDCFNNNPNVKSSLKFLRRMPWARKKVEDLYLDTFG